ncbi:MAG: hypothetical protein J5590_08355 [Clostridia bacterium]|nr:hypothetical protein [Clostridia bacterium]
MLLFSPKLLVMSIERMIKTEKNPEKKKKLLKLKEELDKLKVWGNYL